MDNKQRITDNGQRCILCPTPENIRCGGLDVRRFCELIDPSCPQYDSRYREVIVHDAQNKITFKHTLAGSSLQFASGDTNADEGRTIAISADCCGGLPPGLYEDAGFDDPYTDQTA